MFAWWVGYQLKRWWLLLKLDVWSFVHVTVLKESPCPTEADLQDMAKWGEWGEEESS
jgi:hypothetical protein